MATVKTNQQKRKVGVNCSVADIIAQSYRIPIDAKGPQDDCKLESSKKKNPCVRNIKCRSQCEKTTNVVESSSRNTTEHELSDSSDSSISMPCTSNIILEAPTSMRTRNITPNTRCEKLDLANTLSQSCCRKRRTEEEVSDSNTSCSDSQSDTDSDDGFYESSTKTRRSGPSRCKRYKASPRRKARCSKTKQKTTNQRKNLVKVKPRKKESCKKKEKVIPINLCLEILLNICLDDKDEIWIHPEAKACMINCKDRCLAVQEPCEDQECASEQDNCRESKLGHLPHQEDEDGDNCWEEACSDNGVQPKMIPISVSLEIPLNVYLDERDEIWVDQEAKEYIKCKDQCLTVQEPCGDQECSSEQDNCREPRLGHLPHQEDEDEDDCRKEACSDDSVRTKMHPINVSLEIPLKVYLDERDEIWIDQEAKACIKFKDQCPAIQGPSGDQKCSSDQVSENCRESNLGHSPLQGDEDDDDCWEEACSDDSVRTKMIPINVCLEISLNIYLNDSI